MRAVFSSALANAGVQALDKRFDHSPSFISTFNDCAILPFLSSKASNAGEPGNASNHLLNPGTGDKVEKVLTLGISCSIFSATRLIKKLPSEMPRSPGWQLLME